MDVVCLEMITPPIFRFATRAALVVSLAGTNFLAPLGELDCAGAVRDAPPDDIIRVCSREAAVLEPSDAITARVAVMKALVKNGDLTSARAAARALLSTAAAADARQTLGYVALRDRKIDEAIELLTSARQLHVEAQRWADVARDDQILAGIYEQQDRIGDALTTIASSIEFGRKAGDRRLEGSGHSLAARLLIDLGHFTAATGEFAIARSLLDRDDDLAYMHLSRAAGNQWHSYDTFHRNFHALAIPDLRVALELGHKAHLPPVELDAEESLVDSLSEANELDEAREHLAAARNLDHEHRDTWTLRMLEGRLEYRSGNYLRAVELSEPVVGHLDRKDFEVITTGILARSELALGHLEAAIEWARRGVDVVESMRAELPVAMRPFVMTLRRAPFELLFHAQARANKVDDAIATFDRWYGRTLLDASREHEKPATTLADAVRRSTLLERETDKSPVALLPPNELLRRIGNIDLVALVIADDHVWRIESSHGLRQISDLGLLDAIEDMLLPFEASPTRSDLGVALGSLLLPSSAFRHTDETLHILLDDRLAKIPAAALRDASGLPLISSRPIVRAARLSDLECVPPLPSSPDVSVVADPLGDLAMIRSTMITLAHDHGTAALVGPTATRGAVKHAASTAKVLHVATHGTIGVQGGTLVMSDGALPAAEIFQLDAAPTLTVLTACSSGASEDPELASSLTSAFLAAGSSQVVGTLRPVGEVGAVQIIQQLDRDITDPVRGLARVQAALATTDNTDWPNFAIFGQDTCRKEH